MQADCPFTLIKQEGAWNGGDDVDSWVLLEALVVRMMTSTSVAFTCWRRTLSTATRRPAHSTY